MCKTHRKEFTNTFKITSRPNHINLRKIISKVHQLNENDNYSGTSLIFDIQLLVI